MVTDPKGNDVSAQFAVTPENGTLKINPAPVTVTADYIERTNLLGETSLNDIATAMGRRGYGYGCGMSVLMHPELIGSPAPAGVFGWDGAAGSCITMDTASKTSFVFTMHVRNYGKAYDTIHPRIRDLVFGK